MNVVLAICISEAVSKPELVYLGLNRNVNILVIKILTISNTYLETSWDFLFTTIF